MNRKPIETEDQDGYFACEGCRDERCHEEQDLHVDADGVCWCDDCYTEEHTWEEFRALKPFVPKLRKELARKDAEIARLTDANNENMMRAMEREARLREALERCREYLACEYGPDAEDLERMCAEALEQTK